MAVVWNTKNWSKLAEIVPPGQAAIRTCRISQDSKSVVIAGDDDRAHIFELETYQLLASLKGLGVI